MAYRLIQVGTGGWGGEWCRRFLPPNIREGLVEVVAAVDTNPEALSNAREHLGLRQDQCYADLSTALDEKPADLCTVVVPPAHHEAVVREALAHDLHILSEKPIADTLEASVRIAQQVQAADKKMAVTMSHRFAQDKTTLRSELRSGRHGPLDYLVMRFTCDCRQFGSWGAAFRHEIPDTLMIEGAVHHLDILADLAGAKCDTLYAQTWNPAWGEYQGDSQGLVLLQFENGVRATYEGAKTNAVGLNGWTNEYVRAECRDATLIMDQQRIDIYPYRATTQWAEARINREAAPLRLLERPKWSNTWLVEQFVHWLDGGAPMETRVRDNLQSVAMVFAAIESSRTGQPVKVQAFLEACAAAQG